MSKNRPSLSWQAGLLATLAYLGAFAPPVQAVPLPSGSLVIVHATRRYQSHPDVIETTRQLARWTRAHGHEVFGLGDREIATDPRWYADRPDHALLSGHGEHELAPMLGPEPFSVDLAGGYHCACLGHALADLIRRFADRASNGARLILHLRTRAIYTGYLLSPLGDLLPSTPHEEANLDDSRDGLSLDAVTRGMDDPRWVSFIRASLDEAIFDRSQMRWPGANEIVFELRRRGRLMQRWPEAAKITVELNYD